MTALMMPMHVEHVKAQAAALHSPARTSIERGIDRGHRGHSGHRDPCCKPYAGSVCFCNV
jgi:hypothetical protein